MKIENRKNYICEYCGRTSIDEAKIKECEESHIIIPDDSTIKVAYNKGNPQPRFLWITLPDETKLCFYNNDPKSR